MYLAVGSGVVAICSRRPRGQPNYDGCITDDGNGGRCVDGAGARRSPARIGVAVSPDGTSVYVASYEASDVTHFFAAPQGQLSYDGCVSNGGSDGNSWSLRAARSPAHARSP